MVSGFVQSVRAKLIRDKYYVVVGKVRHSQAMNEPPVDIWIITETDRRILSVHCLGCKAGLGETCTHVASVMMRGGEREIGIMKQKILRITSLGNTFS